MTTKSIFIKGIKLDMKKTFKDKTLYEAIEYIKDIKTKINTTYKFIMVNRDYDSTRLTDHPIYLVNSILENTYGLIDENKYMIYFRINDEDKKQMLNVCNQLKDKISFIGNYGIYSEYYDMDRRYEIL